MRKLLPVVLLASAALVLSGCTAANNPTGDCKGGVNSGSVSDSVKVNGKAGAEPTIKFDKPLKAKDTQRSFVTTGKGKTADKNTTVDVALVAFNGKTGKKLTSSGYGKQAKIPITVGDATLIPGLTSVVQCAPVGSRVVATESVKTAFGKADPSQLGLKKTDSIIFVADIESIVPEKANGAPQKPQDGFPTVKLAASGKPAVTMPKTAPPTETKTEVLKKGTGATLKAGETATVQYQGSIWATGKVFDQSWGRAPLAAPLSPDKMIPGFVKGLVGQKVGSQVVVVIPPADGYGTAGQPDAGIKGTDTLVFVIDILKVAK